MLAGFGDRSYHSQDLIKDQVDNCLKQSWTSIAVYYAESADARSKTGTSTNDCGRAYEAASMPSLAYDAYQESVNLGVSVARANMARIVGHGGVAIVGLQLLEQHQGPFDAASPWYPYDTRAALEKKVHAERERRDRLQKQGDVLNRLLVDLVEVALGARTVTPRVGYIINGDRYHSVLVGADLVMTPTPAAPAPVAGPTALVAAASAQARDVKLQSICAWLPLWEATINERKYVLALSSDGALVGINLKGLAEEALDLVRIKLEGFDA
jgi:hypothetical protein